MDAVVLFFLLGVAAGLAKSDLKLPAALYDALSIYLLLAIGLKGGMELAKQPFLAVAPQAVMAMSLGLVLPLIAFPVLRGLGRLQRADAASIAAHYGSVSVVTFAVGQNFLNAKGIRFEAHMPLILVLLEVPGILVGVLLARAGGVSRPAWAPLLHEVMLGKSIVLLVGGLLIGWAAGPVGLAPMEPFFGGLFKGVLCLFLLEMGLVASAQLGSVRKSGLFLVGFGVGMPLVSAVLGALLGTAIGLSPGGTALLATLAASASYIAAPAAMRIAVPEANPALSITAALAVTFPFNLLLGIPLYTRLAEWLHRA
jgi:uncharacterized protein